MMRTLGKRFRKSADQDFAGLFRPKVGNEQRHTPIKGCLHARSGGADWIHQSLGEDVAVKDGFLHNGHSAKGASRRAARAACFSSSRRSPSSSSVMSIRLKFSKTSP